MSVKDKKNILLNVLAEAGTYVTLHQIIDKLPDSFHERSVRRWLQALIQEGLVKKRGQKRGSNYMATLLPQNHTENNGFSLVSDALIEKVRTPLYQRSPVSYDETWLDAYQPNKTFYIPAKIRQQLLVAGRRTSNGDPAGSYAHQIYNRLLIDLSYNSSRLEGNTYSLLDTERLVLQGKSAENKLDTETIMILNHKEAIRYIVELAIQKQLTNQNILTLHYLLSDGLVEARYSGKVRDHSVRISGSTYLPYDDRKRLQIQLEKILKKANLIIDPYEQSLFLLIHISYLQYFTDVNKRTARLATNIPLIKHNLVPLSFNDINRDDYNSAMITVYEFKDIRPLLDLYVFSYLRTCMLYDATVKAIGIDEIRVRYRQQRRALLREIILNKIIKKNIKPYIKKQALELIPPVDRDFFIEDVLEDIQEIDQSRIVGLGITSAELQQWLKLNS